MDTDTNTSGPVTFRRTKHLPYYLLFVVIAAAWWLQSNTLTAHLSLSILTLLVGAVTILFYVTPKVEFSADGSIKSYRSVIQTSELTAARYFTIQFNFKFFSTRVIELYTEPHKSYYVGIPSQISIPTAGWSKEQRQDLFSRLDAWLSTTRADIDAKTRQHITELAAS
jgi:hypothetical protein